MGDIIYNPSMGGMDIFWNYTLPYFIVLFRWPVLGFRVIENLQFERLCD